VIKTIGTAYRREDFSMPDFIKYWLDVHAPISASAPGMRGYVVSEVVRRMRGRLHSDAFVEQWFDDQEAMDAAMGSPEIKRAWADVPNYAKMTGTFWVVKEHVLIPPPISKKGLLRDA
jgi:uncharacterized protein (TIGR02118 family)